MWLDPFEEMRKMQLEMSKMFNSFWNNFGYLQEFRSPIINTRETDKSIIVYAELPGVDKKDIQLNITENSLEIKVEKKTRTEIKKKNLVKSESSYRGFYKSIILPCKVVPEKAKAKYKDGLLEVILPKAEKKKVKKRIKIE